MTDIEPQNAMEELNDEDLRSLGLEPVRSWVRKRPTGKSARNRRHRDKAQAAGRRQLSVMVPEESRPLVRDLCRELCDGEIGYEDLRTAIRAVHAGTTPPATQAGTGCLIHTTTGRVPGAALFALGFLGGLTLGAALGFLV